METILRQIGELEESVEMLERELFSVRETDIRLQSVINKLESDCSKLKEELSHLQDEKDALESKLSKMENKQQEPAESTNSKHRKKTKGKKNTDTKESKVPQQLYFSFFD